MRARSTAALALLALAAACGDRPTGASSPTAEEFAARAGRAVAAWESAPKGEPWIRGFVPLEELTVLPRDPGFSGRTGAAFHVGAYRLAGRLPDRAPRRGLVRWRGGKTLTVAVVAAGRAYRALDRGPMTKTVPDRASPGGAPDGVAGARAAPCPECDLKVTGARLAPVSLHTSRGPARVPAWWFTVAGLRSPVVRVAVAPAAIGAFPPGPAAASAIGSGPPVHGVQAVPGDPRRLRVTVTSGGPCQVRSVRGLVHESARAIVVGAAVRVTKGTCPDLAKAYEVEVALARPLDGRVLLDSDGRPLRLGERRPVPA